jgi:hypothetical protein
LQDIIHSIDIQNRNIVNEEIVYRDEELSTLISLLDKPKLVKNECGKLPMKKSNSNFSNHSNIGNNSLQMGSVNNCNILNPSSSKENQLLIENNTTHHHKNSISNHSLTGKMKSNEEDNENSSESEVSLNSDKTDCEDNKQCNKSRIRITPLERKTIFTILNEYFQPDFSFQNETDFTENIINGLTNLNSSLNKTKPVKFHYMRRRVCCKLFTVFEKLLKNLYLGNDGIKNLTIFLESKARDGDPDMGQKYKNFIANIFNKIKV